MRYFIRLAYNGAPYHGWQVQPNALSVQQVIEEALRTVLRREVSITGAGRTDTGVNAREMYAHFDVEKSLDIPLDRLTKSLDRLVGRDIAIYSVFEVDEEKHARFSASSRTYKYFITTRKSPFLYPLSWYCPSTLDVEAMNEAAKELLKVEDFTSFAKLHADTKTNICKVTEAEWKLYPEHDLLVFTITADRFLRNMVRAVVGTLLDVGRGKLTKEGLKKIISQKNRCAAGQSVPPQALYLWRVRYE